MIFSMPALSSQSFNLKDTCRDVILVSRLLKNNASESDESLVRYFKYRFKMLRSLELMKTLKILSPLVRMVSFFSSKLTFWILSLTKASTRIPVSSMVETMALSLKAKFPLVARIVFKSFKRSVFVKNAGSLRCVDLSLIASHRLGFRRYFRYAFRDDLILLTEAVSRFLPFFSFFKAAVEKYSFSKFSEIGSSSAKIRKDFTSLEYDDTVCFDFPSAMSFDLNEERAPLQDSLFFGVLINLRFATIDRLHFLWHWAFSNHFSFNHPVKKLTYNTSGLIDGDMGFIFTGSGFKDSIAF